MAYISAEAESSATISGPPSTIAALSSYSNVLRNARKVKLPITAAFHARHLGEPNVDDILGSLSRFKIYSVRKDVDLICTSTGKTMAAGDLGEALRQIVLETLQEPLRWSKVVEEMTYNLKGKHVLVQSVGPVRATDSLLRRMKSQGVYVVNSAEMRPSQRSHSTNRSNDIAIVGFSTRMPESETFGKLWNILEEGKDTHKKASKSLKSVAIRRLAVRSSEVLAVLSSATCTATLTCGCDRYLKIDLM